VLPRAVVILFSLKKFLHFETPKRAGLKTARAAPRIDLATPPIPREVPNYGTSVTRRGVTVKNRQFCTFFHVLKMFTPVDNFGKNGKSY
jgi:hypothetical protein